MSPRLPRELDGRALVRALVRAGFTVDRQSGSHAVLVHQVDPGREVVVPIHPGKPNPAEHSRKNFRQARLSVEELSRLL
jgi:predicted RNA binding protein YcfA (HicA-like mRNA interferase family)